MAHNYDHKAGEPVELVEGLTVDIDGEQWHYLNGYWRGLESDGSPIYPTLNWPLAAPITAYDFDFVR